MHCVIVPVDFSDTALNAARYAAQMLAGKPDVLLLLYNNFQDREDEEMSRTYLESLRMEARQRGAITVECLTEQGGELIGNLARLSRSRTAILIVMGITGRTSMGQKLIGSNTLRMVDHSLVPVLIVPADAGYHGIRHIAFASDMQDVEKSTPAFFISSVLNIFKPRFSVVNVHADHKNGIAAVYQDAKTALEQLFTGHNPEFHFVAKADFNDAIDGFIREHKVDLLVTVPRYHEDKNNLIKSTHTKRLVYHSSVPVMAAHEWQQANIPRQTSTF